MRLYIQARNAPGIFGSLALGIVKISRHGDNGFCHRFTKISFCIRFQLCRIMALISCGEKHLPSMGMRSSLPICA